MTAALKSPETTVLHPDTTPDVLEHLAPVIDITTGQPAAIERSEYSDCMQALQAFVTQQEVVVSTNDRTKVLAETAGHIIAQNWLRTSPETFEDSQATAAMLITLFEYMPAGNLILADRSITGLRAKFGLKHPPGGYDTTYSFLARLNGRALITRQDPQGMGERITDDQMARLHSLRSTYRSYSLHPNLSA